MEELSGLEEFAYYGETVKPFDIDKEFDSFSGASLTRYDWPPEGDLNLDGFSSYESDSLATLGKHILQRLAYLAQKDQRAANSLIFLARKACVDIEELARLCPEYIKPRARRKETFPVVAGRNAGHEKRVRELLNKLEVGEDSSDFSQQRKRFSGGRPTGPASTTPINVLAIQLHNYIDFFRGYSIRQNYFDPFPSWWDECGELPPFNLDTVKQWLNVAWKILMESTNNVPENHPKIKTLGKHREYRGKSEKAKHKHIQNGIKEALRKAFSRIARPPP